MNPAEVQRWLLDQASRLGLVAPQVPTEDFRIFTEEPLSRILHYAMSHTARMRDQELKKAVLTAFQALHKEEVGKTLAALKEHGVVLSQLQRTQSQVHKYVSAGLASYEREEASCPELRHELLGGSNSVGDSTGPPELQEQASNTLRERATALTLLSQKLLLQQQHLNSVCNELRFLQEQLHPAHGSSQHAELLQAQAAWEVLLQQAAEYHDPSPPILHTESSSSRSSQSSSEDRGRSVLSSRQLPQEAFWQHISGKSQAFVDFLTQASKDSVNKLLNPREHSSVESNKGSTSPLTEPERVTKQKAAAEAKAAQRISAFRSADTRKVDERAEKLLGEVVELLAKTSPGLASEGLQGTGKPRTHGPLRLRDLNTYDEAATTRQCSQVCPTPRNNNLDSQSQALGSASAPSDLTTRKSNRSPLGACTRAPSSKQPQNPLKEASLDSFLEQSLRIQDWRAVRKARALTRNKTCREDDAELLRKEHTGVSLAKGLHEQRDQVAQLHGASGRARQENAARAKLNRLHEQEFQRMFAVVRQAGHPSSPLTALSVCNRNTLQQLIAAQGVNGREVAEMRNFRHSTAECQVVGMCNNEGAGGGHPHVYGDGAVNGGGVTERNRLEIARTVAAGDVCAVSPIQWWQGVEFMSWYTLPSGAIAGQLPGLARIPGSLKQQAYSSAAALSRARTFSQTVGMPVSVTPLYTRTHDLKEVQSHREANAAVLPQVSRAFGELELSEVSITGEIHVSGGILEKCHARAQESADRLHDLSRQAEELREAEIPRLSALMEEWEKPPLAEALS